MTWDLLFWIICFAIDLALLASNRMRKKELAWKQFDLIVLTDLEEDYRNPFDSSSTINFWVVPEFIAHGVLCALFLLTWHWFMFLITFPLTCYAVMLYVNQKHLVDVTEVFRVLRGEKNYRLVKLGFYLFLLVVIIFRLVLSVYNSISSEDEAVDFF